MTRRLVNAIDGHVRQTTTVAELLREIGEAETYLADLRTDLVRHARSKGATWVQVGELLGVTAQAARQRYGKRTGPGA